VNETNYTKVIYPSGTWIALLCEGHYACRNFIYEKNSVALGRPFKLKDAARGWVEEYVQNEDSSWEICCEEDFQVEYINWNINGRSVHALVYQSS
jgi:hypothetical protein